MSLDQRFARMCAIAGTWDPAHVAKWDDLMVASRTAAALALRVSTPPVIFHCAPHLAERLDATSDTIPVGELRLPFDGFAVRVGSDYVLLARHDSGVLLMAWFEPDGAKFLVQSAGMFWRNEPVTSQGAALVGDTEDRAECDRILARLSSLTRISVGMCNYLATERPDVTTWDGRPVRWERETIVLPPVRSKVSHRRGENRARLRCQVMHVGASLPPLRAHANTLVRGHFRWQPHGIGRSMRKLIWIEPHVRFRDDSMPTFGQDVLVGAPSSRGSSRGFSGADARKPKRANGFEPSTFSLGSILPTDPASENAGNVGDLAESEQGRVTENDRS